MVAEYFFEGETVEFDAGQALACWHSAAALGHPYTQFRMGQCYQCGFGGLIKDTTIAKYRYKLAAEQGVEEAYDALQTLK